MHIYVIVNARLPQKLHHQQKANTTNNSYEKLTKMLNLIWKVPPPLLQTYATEQLFQITFSLLSYKRYSNIVMIPWGSQFFRIDFMTQQGQVDLKFLLVNLIWTLQSEL